MLIVYHSLDGQQRRQELLMQTTDGETWTAETSALMSRHHPLSHIVYNYELRRGADGVTLRSEWDELERVFHFDSSRDYVFRDCWRDRPLPLHLYSNACLTTGVQGPQRLLQQSGETVEPLRLPLFRRTVLFRVSAPQLLAGQSMAVSGSHPALGCWNSSRYVAMHYAGRGEWLLSADAQGWPSPVEYKYVVVDNNSHSVVEWEEGDNRTITCATQHYAADGLAATDSQLVSDGQVLVLSDGHLRTVEQPWRAAGVVVPVFSLRSRRSFGVGDFGDLRRFVDWAVATGMKVIQLLPLNDTTTDGRWHDSYPYNIVSGFALHPHYVDLDDAGRLNDAESQKTFERRRSELNAATTVDYEAVERVKSEYLRMLFSQDGDRLLRQSECREFSAANDFWLRDYAAFRGESFDYIVWLQFLLHRQLKAAADYARSHGVVLMGDLPIGVSGLSAEVKQHPKLFNTDMQAGTPPDAFARRGQNWGFPTYNWEGAADELTAWLRQRLHSMEQYFDALRIDHILGFFRIWEIPATAVYATLGHFSPALPLSASEIEFFGLPFRRELFTRPFVNDRLIDRIFGIHASYVRDNYLEQKAYGLYALKDCCNTQRKIAVAFSGKNDENSLWIRDGLMQLAADVLFVEDPRQPDMYHPRIGATSEPVFDALSAEERDAYMRLYNNYFFERHNMFWGQQALRRLSEMLRGCRMLVCGEDLGMLPDCVEPVLDQLRILTLELQTMPKQHGFEFTHLEANPIRSVATTSTHDMPPLRLWWQQQTELRQHYYATMLQKEGHAPEQLPAHLAEEIIARHLYCPSMLCLLPLQDWLAADGELRRKNAQEERINTPSDPFNRWQYRMHLTIEQLLAADRFNNRLLTMIRRSRRAGIK